MRVHYREPNIVDKLDSAIAMANLDKKQISVIRLSATELEEFCRLSGYAFAKGCAYTHRNITVAYDWEEQ